MKKILILILLLTLTACKDDSAEVPETITSTEMIEIADLVEREFVSDNVDDFYDELFIEIMALNPQWIDDLGDLTSYGVVFQKDKLTPLGESHVEDLVELYSGALTHLNNFKSEDLNYKNMKWYLEMELEGLSFRDNDMFLSHIVGENRWLYTLLLDVHTIENQEDARNWIKRVEASGETIQYWIQRFEKQIADGYIMDPMSIDASLGQMRSYSKSKAEYMDLYKNFFSKIELLDITEETRNVLIDGALTALNDVYIPNMSDLKEVLYQARKISDEPQGVWSMPNGKAYYDYTLMKHTTTLMTADEIHSLGLKEVERIQAEMKVAFDALGFDDSLQNNLNRLYKEGTSYRGQDAMDKYVEVSRVIEDDLETFFYKEDLPASSPIIKTSPGGNFYSTPSIDGKRPGVYYLDLGGAHSEFTINTLAYHETVPGHHLEREHELLLTNIPMVRKLSFNTAYIEGWALYAEMLADEYGYNTTPQHHIGYLKSELHRAARLVVDTGIHANKWSRDQAVDYLVIEGLLHPNYAEAEVTRYTSWPGQACSYKIGQLKLLELRTMMEDSLGDAYDIRDFHHLVLGEGSMPLSLIEEHVLDYIQVNK